MLAAHNLFLTSALAVPSGNFVTRDPSSGYLMYNGQRFRFSGANCANDIGLVSSSNGNGYGATTDSGYYLTPHSQIDAVLASAQAMNATVIRAFSALTGNYDVPVALTFQPTVGVFHDAGLEPLDYALQRCNALGIKLIIPFVSQYNSMPWLVSNTGGGANTNFWTRTATIDAYKALISAVLNHVNVYTGVAYKNDGAVLCWETGNELVSGVADVDLIAWTNTISAYIKTTCGAQQLLMDGEYGVASTDPAYLGNPLVDIYSDHTYDNTRTPTYLANEADTVHGYGKAYVIGEYDWKSNETWKLEELLDRAEESNIDGDCFWDLLAPLTSWNDGYTVHYPGDTDFMTSRVNLLSDHALRMTGIAPKVFVTDSFTGTDGTVLSSHVGELGATWALGESFTGVCTIQSNRIWAGSTEAHYFSTGVPASSDYTVSADVYIASVVSGASAGVLARSYTKEDFYYAAYVWDNGGTVSIYLDNGIPGPDQNLGIQAVTTPTVGSTHTIKFVVQGVANSRNSLLSVYWDGALVLGPITDASEPAAGRVGVILSGGSTTTGFHIDNITATDYIPVQPVPPVLGIPNRFVGPMALRNQFRRATQPA